MPRFSQTLREHARYPSNQGTIESADRVGRASLNGSPPFISIFLVVSGNKVAKASFDAHGCGVTTAVCSVTTEYIEGKTVEECRLLTVEQICQELDGVPPDKLHCVHVGLRALQSAIDGENEPRDEG